MRRPRGSALYSGEPCRPQASLCPVSLPRPGQWRKAAARQFLVPLVPKGRLRHHIGERPAPPRCRREVARGITTDGVEDPLHRSCRSSPTAYLGDFPHPQPLPARGRGTFERSARAPSPKAGGRFSRPPPRTDVPPPRPAHQARQPPVRRRAEAPPAQAGRARPAHRFHWMTCLTANRRPAPQPLAASAPGSPSPEAAPSRASHRCRHGTSRAGCNPTWRPAAPRSTPSSSPPGRR